MDFYSLTKLQISYTTPILLCGNQSVVALLTIQFFHNRTKHMKIDVFCARKGFDKWADAITKSLSLTQFTLLRSKLNVKNFSSEKSSP